MTAVRIARRITAGIGALALLVAGLAVWGVCKGVGEDDWTEWEEM
jgi:hypothetical protein